MGNGYAQPGSGSRDGPGRADRTDTESSGRTRSDERSRPTLLVNPPSDTSLRASLDRVMAEEAPGSPAELEARMRPEFPRIVVRARALEHESVVVWYVYREGYWVPSKPEAAAGSSAASATAGGATGADQAAMARVAGLTEDDAL